MFMIQCIIEDAGKMFTWLISQTCTVYALKLIFVFYIIYLRWFFFDVYLYTFFYKNVCFIKLL